MKKIITGVKPTGSSMHLGNLLGAVLPFQNIARGNDAAIFIADLHALTSVKNGETMRAQSLELAIEYLSIFGKDTPITIFRQSDIVDITKLMWVLSNVTPYSLMLRAHSFKDTQQKLDDIFVEFYTEKGKYFEHLKVEKEIEEKYQKIKNQFNGENKLYKFFSKNYDKNYSILEITYKDHQQIVHDSKIKLMETEKRIEKIKAEYYESINMGVFNYPILMAADIIGYDIDAVPVGKDQIQHLEMTRDIARAFNKTYGQDVFLEPEAIITKEVETLPGIDGRKMSKSYDNFIGVFDDEKTMKKRVMSIMTGSEGVDEKKKNPDECNVFNLYRIFATAEETAALRVKYESENIGFGYGHAKTALLEVLQRYLSGYRNTRTELMGDIPFVEAKLAEGARIMNARLEAKMKVVKEVTGVN